MFVISLSQEMRKWLKISKPGGTYASKNNVVSQSEKKTAGTEDAREYNEVYRRAVRSGNAEEWTSFGSALLTGKKISKGPKPEKFVSAIKRYRCRQGIRKDIGRVQRDGHLRERMVFAPPSSTKHAWKSKACLQCRIKVQRRMPNDKLPAGLDLLHGLIGTIFRFREGPIALKANIESRFLQVHIPEQDRSCLRFLWRPRTTEPVQI